MPSFISLQPRISEIFSFASNGHFVSSSPGTPNIYVKVYYLFSMNNFDMRMLISVFDIVHRNDSSASNILIYLLVGGKYYSFTRRFVRLMSIRHKCSETAISVLKRKQFYLFFQWKDQKFDFQTLEVSKPKVYFLQSFVLIVISTSLISFILLQMYSQFECYEKILSLFRQKWTSRVMASNFKCFYL